MNLGCLTPTEYIMGDKILKPATGYALQMQITKTAGKMTAASYSRNWWRTHGSGKDR
jgi:hypothetical protein